jgi:hypothetical protein
MDFASAIGAAANAGQHQNIMIVWATTSPSLARSSGHTRRLQQGLPILVSFQSQEDAAHIRATLLAFRASQLEANDGYTRPCSKGNAKNNEDVVE